MTKEEIGIVSKAMHEIGHPDLEGYNALARAAIAALDKHRAEKKVVPATLGEYLRELEMAPKWTVP